MACRPEKETEENTEYNYYLSKVCIHSEHCMGFLKGHWPSLWGLRVKIHNEEGVHYAALWIIAYIHLHAFALDHEDDEFITKDQLHSTIACPCPESNFHGTCSISIVSKAVKGNSQLLINRHLKVIWVVIEDMIICNGFDQIIEAIRSNLKIRSEDLRQFDLGIMKKKVKLVCIFVDRLLVIKVVLWIKLSHHFKHNLISCDAWLFIRRQWWWRTAWSWIWLRWLRWRIRIRVISRIWSIFMQICLSFH